MKMLPRVVSVVLFTGCLLLLLPIRDVMPGEQLPGPGLDVPVDADGDGVSTYGDVYAFNYWLGLGGDLGAAPACLITY